MAGRTRSPQRHRREYSRRLGFASAGNQGLYARLKVVQSLELWAALAYVPFAERERAVATVLEEFGLEDLEQTIAENQAALLAAEDVN